MSTVVKQIKGILAQASFVDVAEFVREFNCNIGMLELSDMLATAQRFDVTLMLPDVNGEEHWPGKINAIKMVRELLGIGLKESKDLVEGPRPIFILRGASQAEVSECFRIARKYSIPLTSIPSD